MQSRTRKLHLLFLSIFCFGQGFANVHFIYPPILNVNDTFIEQESSSTLQIVCIGKYPLSWKIDGSKAGDINDSRLTITSSVNISQPVNKHKSTLTLEDLYFNDSGFYSCFYEGTSNFDSADNVTYVYLFVHDPAHLFVEKSVMAGHLLIPVLQQKLVVIPCLPTNPRANVTLWNTNNEEEHEMVSLSTDVTFDPKRGFQLHYPTLYFSGSFQCKAYLDGAYDEINVTLMFFPVTSLDPQPFIDTSEAQHPVVNGTFTLKCIVKVDPGTTVFMDWDYPNKNDTGSRINRTNPISESKEIKYYELQEVITYLIVKEARTTDSGRYTCTVTDHSKKSGFAEVNIFVYNTQQRPHVNFTTDIDILKPVEYQAGKDVRFVITVNVFPSISEVELYWEKNGERLTSDGHYLIKNMKTVMVLEIKQLHRSDAAIYTLYGKTKDGIDKISITLEVEDKPSVFLKNVDAIYTKNTEYTVECHADSYPVPVVWWRWKPCTKIQNCEPGKREYGWTDVEFSANTPNLENITLEHSNKSTYSLISYLHVTAKESGYYMCAASNEMGNDYALIPFIVTDAKDGFEISISKRKPVDKDFVELLCKVNSYNFTHIEWKWRPMYSVGDLIPVSNLTDVVLKRNSSVYSLSELAVFDPIHRNLSGDYECIASNEKNNLTVIKHITIDVIEIKPPVLNKTNMIGKLIKRDPGSLQEFFCYTEGVPFPTVTWKKDGKIFNIVNMSGVELTERNQKLTIRRVLERDTGFYECVVKNRGGQITVNATLNVMEDGAEDRTQYIVFITLTVGAVILTVFFSIWCCCCWARRYYTKEKEKNEDFKNIAQSMLKKDYNHIFDPALPLEDQIDLLTYENSWEFPKERLKFGKRLGEGAFGRVVKAEAIGLTDGEASTTVAVKMLKEGADKEQMKALIDELRILIHIGKHLNIVNLLGAVTKNLAKGELYVIVEYCCYGNLRHFLLNRKDTFIDQLDHRTGQLDTRISTLPGSPFLNMEDNMITYANILGIGMDNPTYKVQSLHYADIAHDQVTNDSGTGISVFTNPSGSSTSDRYFRNSLMMSPVGSGAECDNDETGKKNIFITTCDLLCVAFQCARGMEYLESRKLIHRDLAARNVLLAKDNVVKICDFGLAKDCYKYSNYIKKSKGLLPIKWMAIESIRDRVFTSKSDVWSFGILLWEIFSLGSNPYPGIEINEEFFKKLKRGYRMEKPDLAPDSIYQLMKSCWLDDPNQRPDFNFLAEQIGALLESSVRKYYVELNAPYQIMNKELLNNNDYLQMAAENEEYTNMTDSSELQHNHETAIPGDTYDNITSIRPVGNEPVPRVAMEVVPMIELGSMSETWGGISQKDKQKELKSNDSIDYEGPSNTEITYLNMGSSPEKYDLDEYDTVFLEQNKVPHINGDFSSVPLLSKINFGDKKHEIGAGGDGCMDQCTSK